MQVMLAVFVQINTKNTAIQSPQADQIGRTYPPLFTINLPKEEEIIDDLKEITAMEYVVQVIMIIVCIAIARFFCPDSPPIMQGSSTRNLVEVFGWFSVGISLVRI